MDANKKSLKLITLNIWQGRLNREVIKFLEREDADIVCLQEVNSFETRQGVIEVASALEDIVEALGFDYIFFEPTLSFDIADKAMSFGNATLSKLPLKNNRAIFTNNQHIRIDSWEEDHERNTRNALISEVDINGQKLTIVNHHGYWAATAMGVPESLVAMKILHKELCGIDGELILAGDLNVVPGSPAHDIFKDNLVSLVEKFEIEDTLSQFGKVRKVPCDHVFISPGVKVQDFKTTEDLVSDHKPLVFEFNLET